MAEGKTIVEGLAKLKYELQHDRKMMYKSCQIFLSSLTPRRPLHDDGEHDIKGYNAELEVLGTPSWFNVPWLYAECYLCRYNVLLSNIRILTKHKTVG